MRPWAAFLSMFISLNLATTIVSAQQNNAAVSNNPSEGSSAFKSLVLSRQLIAYGSKNRDALALIVAAGIRSKLALNAIDRKTDADEGIEAATSTDTAFDTKSILVIATKYAATNDTLLELIEDVRTANSRGKTDGPAYNIKTVKARGKNNYRNINFEGGKYAEIYVEGSGRANLDLYIYDQKNRLVCSDTDPSDIKLLRVDANGHR